MNFNDITYRNISTSSLSVGSFLSKDDLTFFTDDNTSVNFPFGKSDKDVAKLTVYNFDESIITSSMIYAGGTYKAHTQSFYDVTNKYVSYSYTKFNSDWPILTSETSSLFLDLSKELNKLSILDGNYKVVIELLRNSVGSEMSSDDKLIIDTISTNRNEIYLIPKSLRGTTSELVTEYDIFSNNQLQIKNVVDDIVNLLSSPQIYTTYYVAKKEDPVGLEALKKNYGFSQRGVDTSSDTDVISFVTDLYYGVKKGNLRNNGQIASNDIIGIYDQFKNWLYQNYEAGATFQDIRDYYYSLFNYVVNQELNRITNKKPDDYALVVGFLEKIYYNILFYPKILQLEIKYNVDLSGYFKSYINLNSGLSVSLLNKKVVESNDPRYYNKLALKLESSLPLNVSVGDDVWITNDFGFLPIVQNLYYFTKPYIKTIPLRGPNFLVQIESQGNSTEAVSMDQLINQTGSAYDEMLSKLSVPANSIIDNTNYRKFENFVNFSSADLRISAFDSKKVQITEQYSLIADLNAKINENPDDQFYIKEKSDANKEIDRLEASMDGYEKFLYNNEPWYTEHAASASLYDKNNGNSLINNLPQFIVEDYTSNRDYIVFVGMIGHFFDNMSLLIKQITEKNNYSNSPSYGISVDIVEDMLASLGWDAEISKENLPLLLASFSQNSFDVGSDMYNKTRQLSEEQRNQVIWKRILNSLPHIYKTKGTEASLSALLSCFGIPKNIIKIKEYGGIQQVNNLQDTSLYIIDEVKYEPYFSGSGEYFKLNWTGSAQSLEFNFAFDTTKTSEEGKVFRLANCSDKWVVGAYRERGEVWGRLFFSLDDGFGNAKTIMTGKAPIFDGNTYHAMVRRNNSVDAFGVYSFTLAEADQYPIKYDVYVQRADDARITFTATGSQYMSGSYNENFRLGSYVYIGNYNQNTSSLNLDPEAFYGNVDEIKIWECALTDARFESHTLHQNAYDLTSPSAMISENLFRVSFERPLDLNETASVVLNNLAFRTDFPTFEAINFPLDIQPLTQKTDCDPVSGSAFPWQFTRKDTRQTVRLPDYGSNKFRSNKINYVEQELVSALSATERSSRKSSELLGVGANKLGIFFSPAEIQNTEIIKFFGEYPLGDLIGDPACVYKNSYEKFEKFKQVFYDQGFGAIDYQLFMNVVRFYFDKTMFKYIKSIIPARAKLVDGILIEPSILERPKIQLKPLTQEVIEQKVADVPSKSNIAATNLLAHVGTTAINNTGRTIQNDVNSVFYPTDSDEFGFSIYSDNGIAHYKDEYYRADVVRNKKQYQVYNQYALPKSSLDDYEKNVNLDGTVDTISRSYYKTNLARLPVIYEYPLNFSPQNTVNFSGSISLYLGLANGTAAYSSSVAHTIDGIMYGPVTIFGGESRNSGIISPGIYVTASYIGTDMIVFAGNFSVSSSLQMFDGTIQLLGTPATAYSGLFKSKNPKFSIFDEFRNKTYGQGFGPVRYGIDYRKNISVQNYPYNAEILNGYYHTHYKYTKQQFSQKDINLYDQSNITFNWKKGSQNKKTTIDPRTGLLDNSDPVETKTV